MKTVFFIRHAKSSWADLSLDDFDRPLNNRGKRDAPFMAKRLYDLGVRPDAIISSPAKRAFTTAKHFGKANGIDEKDILKVEAIYEAWTSTVFEIIQKLPEDWQTILVFGHNPAFTTIANSFAGDTYIDNVPTCGIVQIEATIDKWKQFNEQTGIVKAFHYPKQYFQ